MRRAIGSILLLFLILGAVRADDPEKYIPKNKRKQEKLATPEPGAYVKPSANYILKRMNRILDDSTSKKPAPWMVDLFTPPQAKIKDTTLVFNHKEVDVRVYYPTRRSMKGKQPVTIFYHGGGFVLGSVEEYHSMTSTLAMVTGQIIVSVDYRLAPAHPYPAAVNDCYAVLQWMQHYGSSLGADTARISVMGDSAGGNLATVMTLKCHDLKRPQPYRQVLLYPAVTLLETAYPSMIYYMQETDRRYVLSEAFCIRVRRDYMANAASDTARYISPLESELSDDLAPTLIIAAECDPLRDSNRAYAQKLATAGVQVQYLEYSGMIHAFMSFPMIIRDAVDAMKLVGNYLGDN